MRLTTTEVFPTGAGGGGSFATGTGRFSSASWFLPGTGPLSETGVCVVASVVGVFPRKNATAAPRQTRITTIPINNEGRIVWPAFVWLAALFSLCSFVVMFLRR